MVAGNKTPDSRYDHGEWVILEGEEPAVRAAAEDHRDPAPPGREAGS